MAYSKAKLEMHVNG